jgi:hypothetical protein
MMGDITRRENGRTGHLQRTTQEQLERNMERRKTKTEQRETEMNCRRVIIGRMEKSRVGV